MIIRGFSSNTSYNCTTCHAKCCATEYNLPLCGSEKQNLIQKYPEYDFFFQSTTYGDKLLRGDACPFLTQTGHCQLHNTKLKPLSCQLYPLIFWKFNQEDVLAWINPCRGNGFRWYSSQPSNLTENYLTQLFTKSNNFYKDYWGEEVDQQNPYVNIHSRRLLSQNNYVQNIPQELLLEAIIENSQFHPYSQLFELFQNIILENQKENEIRTVLNTVLHWLIWSPVGLTLTLQNNQIIFSIAALWLIETSSKTVKTKKQLEKDPYYLQQLGSYYATSILPLFWTSFRDHTNDPLLHDFAKQTHLILTGKLPQQQLNQYLKK